jgi:hypothetical protein
MLFPLGRFVQALCDYGRTESAYRNNLPLSPVQRCVTQILKASGRARLSAKFEEENIYD